MAWKRVLFALSRSLVAVALALMLVPGAGAKTRFKVLYNFTGGNDGGAPTNSALVQDRSGNLYGTAGGGAAGWGVVYKLAPPGKSGKWTETVLQVSAIPKSMARIPRDW